MKVPWHKRETTQFELLKQQLAKLYPDFRVTVKGEFVLLEGSFPIIQNDAELDRFQIRVLIPSDFPDSIPVVQDLSGRIPLHPDWHTYERGSLCILVPEEWLVQPSRDSVIAFLDGPVRNYFISHALAEAGHKRPMGERSHGSDGLFEAYGELVGTKDRKAIQRYLIYLSRDRVKGHWDCACGSGQKLRKCHLVHLQNLRQKVNPAIAAKALDRLRKQIERETKSR